ncbi:MAG: hypothetical protein Q8R18_04720 [bacterium]|nr:hypothetical protein [bacterium]
MSEYTEEEVKFIREAFIQKDISQEDITSFLSLGEVPKYLLSFLPLFSHHRDLFEKIRADEKVQRYSFLGFFPESFPLVYENETLPELSFTRGNRGFVYLFSHPTKKFVIKPFQSKRERNIAVIAERLGVGPKQYNSLEGFLTEELVDGNLFSQLKEEKTSPEQMYSLGRRVGEILFSLHKEGIFYNDTILSDDYGRSHVLVPEQSPAKLFDYGVAVQIGKDKIWNDDEVYDYARTLPMINAFFSGSVEERKHLIEQFRPEVEFLSAEDILRRDISFIFEGLHFAEYRFCRLISEPFLKGFKEVYPL